VSGAEFIPNCEVYALRQSGTYGAEVDSRQYRFRARHVLLCTNAFSVFVHPYFVGKVIPTRAQVLATAPLPEKVIDTCGYSDYGYMYYRMTFDNRLLLGGGRKAYQDLESTCVDRLSEPV
jgi:glycine/D-amino acid oxidase-like deaminating enzyme